MKSADIDHEAPSLVPLRVAGSVPEGRLNVPLTLLQAGLGTDIGGEAEVVGLAVSVSCPEPPATTIAAVSPAGGDSSRTPAGSHDGQHVVAGPASGVAAHFANAAFPAVRCNVRTVSGERRPRAGRSGSGPTPERTVGREATCPLGRVACAAVSAAR